MTDSIVKTDSITPHKSRDVQELVIDAESALLSLHLSPQPLLLPTAPCFTVTLLNEEVLSQPVDSFDVVERHLRRPIDPKQFIKTKTGNLVSRRSVLHGSQRILLAGKSTLSNACLVRGDLATLRIGQHCFFGISSLVRPPSKHYQRTFAYLPMTLGSNIFIGRNSIIEAARIGDCVIVSDDCIVSSRCILQDACILLPGTVLPPDTVVPPFTVYWGNPGREVAHLRLSEGYMEFQKYRAETLYEEINSHI